MLSTLIISPNLKHGSFVEAFLLHLLNQPTTKVNVLISPNDTEIPKRLGQFLGQERLRVWFGAPGNGQLIRKIVNENQITTVYLLPFDHVDDDSASTMAQRTRHYLSQLCSLLDSGIRRCLAPQPILVPIFFTQKDGGNVVTHSTKEDGHGQQPGPIVQCQNEHSARFSSAHALLHSFAVSYRLNIQIALLPGQQQQIDDGNGQMEFLMGLAKKVGGRAEINQYSGEIIGNGNGTETKGKGNQFNKNATLSDDDESGGISMGRMLLFGTSKRLAIMNTKELPSVLLKAETKPGLDSDEAVEEEILNKGPSHVGFACGADEETMAGWEAGGAGQLRENVRQNLFTPWLLRQICNKFGLNFIMLDSEGKIVEQQKGANECQHQQIRKPSEAERRYAVVSQFAARLAQL